MFGWPDPIEKIFKNIEIVNFMTTALKSILNLVNVVKCEKYDPVKFGNFVYFGISFPRVIQKCSKFTIFIFGISETKVCSFTNFRMLFNAVVMNLTISIILKILSIIGPFRL